MPALLHHFTLRPSNYLTLTIVFAHAVAMGALILIPLPNIALLLLLAVLSCSMVYYVLRDARLKLNNAWIALRLEENSITLDNHNGEVLTGSVLNTTLITPHLVVLNIAPQNRRAKCTVVLMSDSMDAEAFRRLRVALKWLIKPTV